MRIIPPHIRELFKAAAFNPLPLTFLYNTSGAGRGLSVQPSKPLYTSVLHAMMNVPELASLCCANGYKYSFDDSLFMCRYLFGSTEDTSDQIFNTVRKLQEHGVLSVSRTVASNIIVSMRGGLKPCSAHYHVEHPFLAGYEALVELDSFGSLQFDLEHVIQQVLDPWRGGAVDATMTLLLERIDKGESR